MKIIFSEMQSVIIERNIIIMIAKKVCNYDYEQIIAFIYMTNTNCYFCTNSDFNKLRYDYSFLKSEYEHEQVVRSFCS